MGWRKSEDAPLIRFMADGQQLLDQELKDALNRRMTDSPRRGESNILINNCCFSGCNVLLIRDEETQEPMFMMTVSECGSVELSACSGGQEAYATVDGGNSTLFARLFFWGVVGGSTGNKCGSGDFATVNAVAEFVSANT